MPDTQPTTPAPSTDHLTSLYKMSRTAGLGSTEYVAINGAAVTAFLLGFASWLSFFTNVLLVIPLVGVVFAIVSLRQIAHSSGTQGGRVLAWGGLLLSLLFAGIVVGGQVRETLVHRQDSQSLQTVINSLSDATRAGDLDKAYALFSPRFQSRVNRERFDGLFNMARSHPVSGDLEYMKWNAVPFQFEAGANPPERYAAGAMLVKFAKSDNLLRAEMTFHDPGDGNWKIDNIPSFFPDQPAAAAKPGGQQQPTR